MGGFRLHAVVAGERRPTVVFDAALAGSSISWTMVQPLVQQFARTLTYDRAGFGWSERGPLPRTAGTIADELDALLRRLDEPPPYVLVGHSFGGLVMRIYAARHPDRTAALILVDPAQPEDWVTPSPYEQSRVDRGVALCRHGATAARIGLAHVVSALVGAGALRPARAAVQLFTRGDFGASDEGILAPMWKLPPEARRPLRYFWTQPKFFEALGSQIETISISAVQTLDAGTDAYRAMPLVTISSTDPGRHRLRQQEALAARSTRGRHVIAPNSSHWVPLDAPAFVADVIREEWEDLITRDHREGT